MKIGGSHLTYCTNIHPGETWEEVFANLKRYLPAIKASISPDARFGIGLRLSAEAAETLAPPAALDEFRDFLDGNGLYVFTINGFPYGTFHGRRVKEDVYLPDWQSAERVLYTNRLADILAALLPTEPGLEGSISTVPGAFAPRATTSEARMRIVENIVQHVVHLLEVDARTGQTIALALEPEPCCLFETVADSVAFFRDHLHSRHAIELLMSLGGLSRRAAETALWRHVGVCLDLCHAAVEFEDPKDCVQQLAEAGIRILKVQISAGLRIPVVSEESMRALKHFDDAVYLHQVVERNRAGMNRYLDLPDALASAGSSAAEREWRVHFHVPIFIEALDGFESTQPFIRDVLALHCKWSLSQHLEVETYTWDVLPERYRRDPVQVAVARELSWVRDQLVA